MSLLESSMMSLESEASSLAVSKSSPLDSLFPESTVSSKKAIVCNKLPNKRFQSRPMKNCQKVSKVKWIIIDSLS
jgi:hypothetical protein